MSEWVSVKKRLPEDKVLVLVIVSGKPRENIILKDAYELAIYYVDEGFILEEYPDLETPDVTYWMPLPEPPEEQAE